MLTFEGSCFLMCTFAIVHSIGDSCSGWEGADRKVRPPKGEQVGKRENHEKSEAKVVEWQERSPPTKMIRVQFLEGSVHRFSHVKTCRDDTACQRVFSGISHSPHPISPVLLHIHITDPSSVFKTIENLPNLSTQPEKNRKIMASSRYDSHIPKSGWHQRICEYEYVLQKIMSQNKFTLHKSHRGRATAGAFASNQIALGSIPDGLIAGLFSHVGIVHGRFCCLPQFAPQFAPQLAPQLAMHTPQLAPHTPQHRNRNQRRIQNRNQHRNLNLNPNPNHNPNTSINLVAKLLEIDTEWCIEKQENMSPCKGLVLPNDAQINVPTVLAFDNMNRREETLSVGLRDLAVESGAIAEGSINKVLEGKYYNRAILFFKLMIPIDQAIEGTANKDTQTPGGTRGFSLRKEAVLRYYINAEYRASGFRSLLGILSLAQEQLSHPDLQATSIKKDEDDVSSLIDMLQSEWTNPFEQNPSHIVHLSTEVSANADVANDLLNAKKKGHEGHDEFQNRLARVHGEHRTFEELSHVILLQVLNIGSSSLIIDAVFDVYRENSIKTSEWEKRGSEDGINFSSIKSGHKIICWRRLPRSGESKTELIRFLVDSWQGEKLKRIIGEKEIFVTVEDICIKITSKGSETIKNQSCTHEKADTRMMLHAKHTAMDYPTVLC
ncbi:hypothetical protein PR048_010496 [Dryococelus australis]|uniref:Uncharacterized protein n=1 Tax=Dryococelus australis TaxID=614101 RepID=A0ABQ9I2W1_9NEOP|nr:hypothetical protein PR048_010496 [Dryococelus australis]